MAKRYRKKYTKKPKTLKNQVATLTRKVNAIGKPEVKHLDYATSGAIPTYAGLLGSPLFTAIVQGPKDFGNRIGDKITLKTFNMRSTHEMPFGAEPTQLRCIIFTYKHNPDSVVTNSNTIINLLMSSATHNSSQFIRAFRDWDNSSSFVVHYDKTRRLSSDGADNGGLLVWNHFMKIPKSSAQVQFNQDGTLVTKNELFVLWISDTVGTTTIDSQYRLTYTDE